MGETIFREQPQPANFVGFLLFRRSVFIPDAAVSAGVSFLTGPPGETAEPMGS